MNYFLYVFVYVMLFSVVKACVNYQWNPFSHKKHLAALILARGGSKGIRLKNIAKVGNRTLIQISTSELKKVKGFSSVWISTDNWHIFEATKSEQVNIHWRSKKSATDTASSISAVQEFLKNHKEVEKLALIQCTSPFLKSTFLQKAVEKIENCDCVFSVTRSNKLQWKEENGKLTPVNFDPIRRPRRQDLKGYFVENGMFYLSNRKLIDKGTFQTNR